MKAQTVTKLNNLLNMGRPKSQHEDRSHVPYAEYVTPDHVACVRTIKEFVPKIETVSFDCKDLSGVYSMVKGFPATKFNRKYLMEILSNMDCDNVVIGFEFEHPLYIGGSVEDDEILIECAVAPIIGDEEQ